jgi:Thiamine pyrophosphate enzyme, N-terminal TPP binding domain
MTSILVRHEHAATAMAAAYAQLTGTPGAVLVTAGPGVTNVVTAVAEALVGALPMIILAGRGSTASVYRGASQEVGTDQIPAAGHQMVGPGGPGRPGRSRDPAGFRDLPLGQARLRHSGAAGSRERLSQTIEHYVSTYPRP